MIGYDPYNEPFSTTADGVQSTFTTHLECFYTAGRTRSTGQRPTLVCPPDDPSNGVVPTIESVDHQHLIFVEPDIYWVTGGNIPSQLGPMPFRASSSTSTTTAVTAARSPATRPTC